MIRLCSSRAITQPVRRGFGEKVVSQARYSRRGQVVRPKLDGAEMVIALLIRKGCANPKRRSNAIAPAFIRRFVEQIEFVRVSVDSANVLQVD